MISAHPGVITPTAAAIKGVLRVKLRPYQSELEAKVWHEWALSPKANVCMQLATGGGKTRIIGSIVYKHQGAAICIAHRNELVGQLSMALAECGVRHRIIADEKVVRAIVKHQIEKLGTHFHYASASCAVAGAQTLLGKRAMREHGQWFSQVTLQVHDEAHHVLKENTWGRAAALFPNARMLGPTATPERSDGKGLGRHADGLFDVLVQGPSMGDLIRMGYLTPYRIFCPPGDFRRADLEVSKSTGDFTAESIKAATRRSTITGDVVKSYRQFIPGKLAFTFAADLETARIIAGNFNAEGVKAAVLDGNTEVGLRINTIRAFGRREVLNIVNCQLFGEGTDVPNLDGISMTAPTESFPKFAQEFGRPLRLSIADDIYRKWETYTDEQRRAFIAASDKPYAFIIDHVGNVKRHGLPDARVHWSLDRRERGGKNRPDDVMPTKTCSNCTGEYEAIYRACPYCGAVPVPASRSALEFVDGDLMELDAATLAAMRGAAALDNDAPSVAGLPGYIAASHQKKHGEKMQARARLKETMALWAGWRQAQGDTRSMAQRRFYHQFGSDVLTVLTFKRAETDALNDKLRSVLTRASVRSTVPLVYNEELPE